MLVENPMIYDIFSHRRVACAGGRLWFGQNDFTTVVNVKGNWLQTCFFLFWGMIYSLLGGGNSNIFYLHPYLGKMNPFWRIFQWGWFNHQPDSLPVYLDLFFCQRVAETSLSNISFHQFGHVQKLQDVSTCFASWVQLGSVKDGWWIATRKTRRNMFLFNICFVPVNR